MSGLPPSITLTGMIVRLEPLTAAHESEIAEAAKDPAIWKHTAFARTAHDYVASALKAQAEGEQVPFVVRRLSDGKVCGMSRLFEIDAHHRRCEIGYTWYIPEEWGTKVNPEAKLLLMTHCFEVWGARRVQFKTDHENLRSQAAIAKLGAVKEGVLRAHMIRPDGTQRHSVIYSVTNEEWPKVKAGLEARLD
ncbi:N-acetyltransferase [Terrihabitans soli]|uniref:N-acetyltransferase n=1 Tax=Terrihabitans soli TaxID=708113 RepID=A0A6S6QJP8_9HYPH|nr:GNAT family protein [Terrihabitans soli]BCJ89456.1 N-acetyltransferase [Terrihabitans soli]